MFNVLTSSVTKRIYGGFFLGLCDFSLLCYADDVLMISSNLASLQGNLDQLIGGYNGLGLKVNAQKTEFMVIYPRSPSRSLVSRIEPYVIINGTKIFSVHQF